MTEAVECSHKALVPVYGVPMLVRVVRSLRTRPEIASIAVSIDDPSTLDGVPELRDMVAEGSLHVHESLDSPSSSVSDYLGRLPAGVPLLVTTADHALLTSEMIGHFWVNAAASEADLVVGLVAGSDFRREFPEQPRTLIPLGDDTFSGANLFAFKGPAAAKVADFWVRAERHRKKPWRLVGMFGLVNLGLFVARRLDLESAMKRASKRIGARIEAVVMPFPECAIDVDKPSDLELARRILAQRGDRAA